MKYVDKITVSPGAIARRVGDELVILNVGSGTYFGLDHVGARIWQLLEEGLAADDIANKVATETGAPLDRVSADVQTFIDSLKAEAILVDTTA